MGLSRIIGVALAVLLVCICGLSGYFLATSPVAFQKATAVTAVGPTELSVAAADRWFDIRPTLEKIPYKFEGQSVYEVDPARKYRRTIEQGDGNCSNLAFGLAYQLSQGAWPYQIVHILPRGIFLAGHGHTVMSMPVVVDGTRHRAIVDVLNGGLLADDSGYVDLDRLRGKRLSHPRIHALSALHDEKTPHYEAFLAKSEIGVLRHQEIAAYFKFIEAVHVPLGGKKLEKIIFDALAVLCGTYPRVYVDTAAFEALFDGVWTTWVLAECLLCATRLFLLLGCLWLAALVVTRLSAKIRRSSHDPSPK